MSFAGPGNIVASPAPPQDTVPAIAYSGRGLGNTKADDKDAVQAVPQYGAIAAYVRQAWTRNYRAKELVDKRLLVNLRARRAKYSPEDQALYTRNGVAPPYEPLAAVKMRAAEAAINELIVPDGDRPWGLDPSPIPELPPEVKNPLTAKAQQAAAQMMQQATADGKPLLQADHLALETSIAEKLYDQQLEALRKEAHERAVRMEDEIESAARMGNYYEAMHEFTSHFATFPAAILKGPYTRNVKRLEWGGTKPKVVEEPVKPKVIEEPVCYWSTVNPFDAYPAPQAATAQEGDFIERLRLTRADLVGYIGVPGYDAAAIRRVIEFKMNGNLQSWLWSDIERREIEGYTTDVWKPDYLIDALHCWCSLSGKDLIAHGITEGIDDQQMYYEVDVVLIDNEVIRCEVNADPLGRRPYWNASYDPIPGAFWGNSIYDLMEDCQGMANAALRALNANMGLASGPIVGVDVSKLADGEDPKTVAPLQTIQLDTGRSTDQDARTAIVFWQANSNANELRGIMEAFKSDADDLTGIPRYLSGDPKASGAGETLGGLSLLMGSAAKGLRRAASVIDLHVITPTITMAYEWMMMYGKNELAKGDCKIVARGSAAILIKEHLQQVRLQYLSLTANPIDMQIIGLEGRRAIHEQVVKALDMPTSDIVPTAEQLAQKQEQAGPPQPTPDEQLKAKVDLAKMKSKEAQSGQKVMAGLVKQTADQTGANPLSIAAALAPPQGGAGQPPPSGPPSGPPNGAGPQQGPPQGLSQ
jgi:hypothetical protein